MDFNEYVIRTRETVIYASEVALHYLIPGLLVEALELEKAWIYDETKEAGDCLYFCARIADELGVTLDYKPFGTDTVTGCKTMIKDRAWHICDKWVKSLRDKTAFECKKSLEIIVGYVCDMAAIYEVTLSDIMQANVDKLADRNARGVLSGSGDNR